MTYNRIRGTEDWINDISEKYQCLTNTLFFIAQLNGYREIRTPIMESSELFIRSVGATSDIIKKEFYLFKDKSEREIALRPEGTAGSIRAVVEEKLIEKTPYPIKLCYCGPMFRYERPQNGRLRQFNQFGIECINTNSVYDDVDVLMFALSILQTLGLKKYEVKINNIGNFTSRKLWIETLQTYFEKYRDKLSELSQSRIKTNPLRILDDKQDGPKDFVQNAPKIDQFLTKEEKENFQVITSTLKVLNVKFTVDSTLVRGLDYYTNFIFEIVSTDAKLAGQPTIIGGGRYSNLVKELGGKDCNCIGFALGLERLLIALEYENILLPTAKPIDVVIAPLSKQSQDATILLLALLRSNGISAVCRFDTIKLTKNFDYANALKAKFVIIIGDKELSKQSVVIKNQKTLKQETIKFDNVVNFIKKQD